MGAHPVGIPALTRAGTRAAAHDRAQQNKSLIRKKQKSSTITVNKSNVLLQILGRSAT